MTEVGWSTSGGALCIRLRGLPPEATVEVHPTPATTRPGQLQPMAGHLHRDGDEGCFVPRFAFVDGTPYTVSIAGQEAAVLRRTPDDRPGTTEVLTIYPAAATVPRNLLRMYVGFSAPMSEGAAATHLRLVDAAGATLDGALLSTPHELWDADRRRLTVLLDPARIKRGLPAHRQAGYALRTGASFSLVVDREFPDARGVPLAGAAARRYEIGGDERRRLEPAGWDLRVPAAHTVEPFEVRFDRPLDHGLLARCLHVVGPDGVVEGEADVAPGERSWRLTPSAPWRRETHRLEVDGILEDVAGNSVSRVFERDLTCAGDSVRVDERVTVGFRPG
jgi:hypothetical protein